MISATAATAATAVTGVYRLAFDSGDGAPITDQDVNLVELGAAVSLPYGMHRYFTPHPDATLITREKLVLTRLRPQGVANAAQIMLAAYNGQHPRRAPISVQPLLDGLYLVKDGNSTVANAIASGWPDVICVLA